MGFLLGLNYRINVRNTGNRSLQFEHASIPAFLDSILDSMWNFPSLSFESSLQHSNSLQVSSFDLGSIYFLKLLLNLCQGIFCSYYFDNKKNLAFALQEA